MELKLPPVIIVFSFALLMYVLDRFLPFGEFDFFGRHTLIKVLLVTSILVSVFSIAQFFRSRTTVDPSNPLKTTKLVTNGIYRFTRNPMYLSMLIMLLAWGLWLCNAFNTLLAAGFVSYMNRFQIKPEENALAQLFGKEYQIYCKNVRRWF